MERNVSQLETDALQTMNALNKLLLQLSILRDWRIQHTAGTAPDYKEIVILYLIGQYPGIRATDVSKFLNRPQGSVSGNLKPLITKGYVIQDTAKRVRNKPLHLSREGKVRLEQLSNAFTNYNVHSMFKDLKIEDIEILKATINILSKKVDVQFKKIDDPPVPDLI